MYGHALFWSHQVYEIMLRVTWFVKSDKILQKLHTFTFGSEMQPHCAQQPDYTYHTYRKYTGNPLS